MPEKKVVLVTGVGGYWGARVAARLLTVPGLHVIGLDGRAPKERIRGLDFIQADVRNPLLPELFQDEHIEAVCHLAFVESDRPDEAAFDQNVLGTIRVMGACAEAGVRKVVLQSSTLVYGARPDNSAFLGETHALHGCQSNGTLRDLMEIATFCNGFCSQFPQTAVTVLRFPGIVGPAVNSPLTRFLRELWTPVLLGFDPLMQVIHEDDVVGALAHAMLADIRPGIYNIAAEGVLPLTRLMSLAGKLPIPVLHVGLYWGKSLLSSAGIRANRYLPIEPDYLRYACVADLGLMRESFGFAPHYTAVEALREFAGYQRIVRYLPERAARAYDEERLRDIIERRRRERAHQASDAAGANQRADSLAAQTDGRDPSGAVAAAPDGPIDSDDADAEQDYEVEPHGQ